MPNENEITEQSWLGRW